MLMSAVIHPDAFDRSHFATPGYRDQAELLLRGLECNGLLLSDPDSRLLNELDTRVAALSTKDGQQIQIRLAELQKKKRKRIVVADRSACPCAAGATMHDLARTVRQGCSGDTIIVDQASHSHLTSAGCNAADCTLLGSYFGSHFEQQRHYCHDQVPPIDKMQAGEFDGHMIRCTRFAHFLRFYDKQIGKGSSLGEFARGIGHILGLWVPNAHYPKTGLSVEIYTCVQKTHDPVNVVHTKIRTSLVRRLSTEHGIRVTLYFKEDAPNITHDRYLQTNSVAIYFSKGFDFIEPSGALHRCTAKIDNGAFEHLQDYRQLKDRLPPAT